MIIQPYSAITLALNQINFPSLEYAWTYDNANFTTGVITCPITGATVTDSGTLADNGSNAYSIGGVGNISAFVCPDPTLMIGVMANSGSNAGQTRIIIQSDAGAISLRAAPAGGAYTAQLDASTYHTLADPSESASYPVTDGNAVALTVDWAGNGSQNCYADGDEALVVSNTASVDISAGPPTMATPQLIHGNTVELSGVYVFSAVPSALSLRAGLAWMAKNHGEIYPGWKGL